MSFFLLPAVVPSLSCTSNIAAADSRPNVAVTSVNIGAGPSAGRAAPRDLPRFARSPRRTPTPRRRRQRYSVFTATPSRCANRASDRPLRSHFASSALIASLRSALPCTPDSPSFTSDGHSARLPLLKVVCSSPDAYGTSVMLFARQRQDERAFWFLGPAIYVSHEGERPMTIKWKLQHPLPGDLFATFAAAVA